MKARELIVWCLLFIAIAILLRSGCGDGGTDTGENIYIKGKTDTLIHRDTVIVEKVVNRLVPYKVEVYTGPEKFPDNDTSKYSELVDPCDSVRFYSDSSESRFGKAVVQSNVRGIIIGQKIILSSYTTDTSFSRVDTLKIKSTYRFGLGVHACADLHNGPGAGIDLQLNRITIGYTYFISQSSQIRLGYTLFRR